MKDSKVIPFDIYNSLFDILRFNIILAETMIKASILFDTAFPLFYRILHNQKKYTILNIENKQNCLIRRC
jgi:hypothetical protein